ncbi:MULTISPECIES: CPBP family intramembrane glutamic endopeptidase [Staphylococcus]|uniref:CPBP family intramembrane glutamic endopeptidase n=1 Tax=Staphylococcus TaxID=1279 RepID=UPI0019544D21|nr:MULTISPECIES: CPBP family intramembrane glutamic endopeptidase [Staphylococcus]MCT2553869.1 CPBP family intramembrane metalloprotease [Staphylococcus aureus]MCT2569043.1 CPBP family intramembrane metalloprotease [Staphylococcus aureus]MCT2572835.1 CPBP family intramembrane metalloprotease [Staphylococcus aureus]MCT2575566.1 CPBP family intramembrane metalloprotease [Staphylococcus aureus]
MKDSITWYKSLCLGFYDGLKNIPPLVLIYLIVYIHDSLYFNPSINVIRWVFGVIVSTLIFFLIFKFNFFAKSWKLTFTNKSFLIVIGSLLLINLINYFQNVFDLYKESKNQKILEETLQHNQEYLHFYFVDMVIVAPIYEEIIFRGIIYFYFIKAIEKLFSQKSWKTNVKYSVIMCNGMFIITSSLLFAYLHAWDTYIEAIPYLSMGIILSVVVVIWKNIINSILIHMINNFFAFMHIETNEIFSLLIALIVVAIIMCLLELKKGIS